MSPLLLHSNTNQYNINGLLCTYTKMFRIQTCCNHILSAAEGFWGGGGGGGGEGGDCRRQHVGGGGGGGGGLPEATCADPGIFVSFI